MRVPTYPLSKAAVEAAAKVIAAPISGLPWQGLDEIVRAEVRRIAARALRDALEAWEPSQEQGEVLERERALSPCNGADRCIDGMKAAVLTDVG